MEGATASSTSSFSLSMTATSTLMHGDLETVTEKQELDTSQNIETRICVVGQKCRENTMLNSALKKFPVIVLHSVTGEEFVNDLDYDTVFVLEEFAGNTYEMLHKKNNRLMGPNVFLECAEKDEELPYNTRPLYCLAMSGLVVCFTGFRKKEDLTKLVTLIHHMGGSIRKDFTQRVTHLVSNSTSGEKYRVAVSLGKPIMSEKWIEKTWEERNRVGCHATEEHLMQYKVPPFFACSVSFLGFSDEEQKHMEEILVSNGGQTVPLGCATATHLVVEERSVKEIPDNYAQKMHIIRAEWFWASIQIDACAAEELYFYEQSKLLDTLESARMTPGTPVSGGRQRKRKRLKENLAQLVADDPHSPTKPVPTKRRSADYNARLSMSVGSLSFLDETPEHTADVGMPSSKPAPSTPHMQPLMTKRQQVTMELLETETNYVNILETIIKLFKDPLDQPDQVGGPLLSPTEIKLIFGNLPPIYEVHLKMKESLAEKMASWDDNKSIGNIILQNADALLKAYPPFVNFFEKTKEALQICDHQNTRFHAFLKICQSKPECGRQSLMELLIRPVQRLPSIILLLNDLLKHTPKVNCDHTALDKAIEALKEVMRHINEDKRKTEGQVVMFDIVNDIDNCPADLLSSHRQFVTKADMVELNDSVGHRGDNLTMFLFNDRLEICKRRMKVINSMKSPVAAAAATISSLQKCYKHVELIHLSHIRRVVDIQQTEDCRNVFALVIKSAADMKERLFVFTLVSEDVPKTTVLRLICRHMANTVCRTDAHAETKAVGLEQHIIKFATKTTNKVARAFSFNKTPRKLKRAMSTMMSPWGNGTPSTTMQVARLASCDNLASPGVSQPVCDTGQTPKCSTGSKGSKFKSSTIGHSAIKRL
ncbi:PREDICTED: protein ECT2-like [Priapulus caudatus]|uniref:Protein ECT2-like n=1 Tax=Priapulus caudatus TaxID=37621 RepID=A0ABM1EYX5_PRICU|nr:PREDICTED: protein ECT2-like [Priapulus caudatus]